MRWAPKAYVALGLWVLLAPWVLGYASVTGALWSNLITGALILLLSLWVLVGEGDDSHEAH